MAYYSAVSNPFLKFDVPMDALSRKYEMEEL
jgi:hypothetical protein